MDYPLSLPYYNATSQSQSTPVQYYSVEEITYNSWYQPTPTSIPESFDHQPFQDQCQPIPYHQQQQQHLFANQDYLSTPLNICPVVATHSVPSSYEGILPSVAEGLFDMDESAQTMSCESNQEYDSSPVSSPPSSPPSSPTSSDSSGTEGPMVISFSDMWNLTLHEVGEEYNISTSKLSRKFKPFVKDLKVKKAPFLAGNSAVRQTIDLVFNANKKTWWPSRIMNARRKSMEFHVNARKVVLSKETIRDHLFQFFSGDEFRVTRGKLKARGTYAKPSSPSS
ncbi:hypothetical protein SAMD00019534_077670 [Acytostelium subglobosum LB1]|uniref:hypothetical protein n=1 Tax=Acytostelium subglobosum LB1 TaxID=1410327 RepID=UPI0006449C70|nr:hypothetical protein SAMD00019534_077670 [Acytostelium subglobosum LB1]GAM24592.1 hypothetical protein SAMD00019534_077670 [Acytostelium subglobosum LB1]|eukprot:XP_012752261.1 hypothetical protein SAMD00019534_077670 [Acytostelium subglobosum LB1]